MENTKINKLFDSMTFVQTDKYLVNENVGILGDGVITGYGAVASRLVYACFVDETVLGGAFGSVQAKKLCNVLDAALKNGSPFVYVVSSAGVRLDEGLDALNGLGLVIRALSHAKGHVPMICLIQGSCCGINAEIAQFFDFVIMNQETGSASLTQETVVKAADPNGDLKGFGSAAFCGKSGFASLISADEEAVFADARKLLTLLPDNSQSGAPDFSEDGLPSAGFCSELEKLAANQDGFRGEELTAAVLDPDTPSVSLFGNAGLPVAITLGVLGGSTVGVIACGKGITLGNQALTVMASFVSFCDTFRIPVVNLTSSVGFEATLANEKNNQAGAASQLAYAYAAADVPKTTVVCGPLYQGAVACSCLKTSEADFVAAWKNADVAALSPEASVEIYYAEEIKNAENPAETRKQLAEEYKTKFAGPTLAAAKGLVDEIINPGETRAYLISALMMLSGKGLLKY